MYDYLLPANRQYIEQLISSARSKGCMGEDGFYRAQLFDLDDMAHLVEFGGTVVAHVLQDEELGQWRIDTVFEDCFFSFEDFRPLLGSVVGH